MRTLSEAKGFSHFPPPRPSETVRAVPSKPGVANASTSPLPSLFLSTFSLTLSGDHYQSIHLSPVYQVEKEEKRDPSEVFQAPGSNLSFSLPIGLMHLDWWNFISHKLLVAKGPFLHSKSKGQDPEHPIPIGPTQQPSPGPSQLPEPQRG